MASTTTPALRASTNRWHGACRNLYLMNPGGALFTCTLDTANNRGVFSSLTASMAPKQPSQLWATRWSYSAPIEQCMRQPAMSCTPLFLQYDKRTVSQDSSIFAAIDPSLNVIRAYNGSETGRGVGSIEMEALCSGQDIDQQSPFVALHSWRCVQGDSPSKAGSERNNSRAFLVAARRNGRVTIASASATTTALAQ